jgi:hypothetical protein
MKKLKLDAEALRVESFAVRDGRGDAKGTVAARSFVSDLQPCSEPPSVHCLPTDPHLNTCGGSCVEMCDATDLLAGCDG